VHANITTDCVLGDVDADGDLDLVCANYPQSNALYLNEGHSLSTGPTMLLASGSRTRSVALGDIDGDGYLDLVCGNWQQGTTIYLNEGGLFPETATWTTEPLYTTDVVLGDVNGDGRLDLVCGNVGEPTVLFLNQDGGLSPSRAWSSGLPSTTEGLALGDVDGDGDLDLVCANYNESNTLYLNDGQTFSADPIWSSTPQRATTSVALGDVDGDGDLDLVCGNHEQPNTVYLNSAGTFQPDPAWQSDPVDGTRDVVLDDVDADGDLDLVCANDPQANTLYLNSGTGFPTQPVWQSGSTNSSHGAALGDVDGDGDLDLVCANGGIPARSNTMYLNQTPGFQANPEWSSAPPRPSYDVVLGDIDADGDPDLVCAHGEFSNALYLNASGDFPTSPGWYTSEAYQTRGMALGDVDGDGDLDLVCGNDGVGNTLHLNGGQGFSTRPSWRSGPDNPTTSVVLGDVDGDGDLDLVCGNDTQSNALYLNSGRGFATQPDWASDARNRTESVALGDVDGDGDLDLACGNYEHCNTLYLNEDGTFFTSVAWSSSPAHHTKSIALADVDGDNDLDLVCGNYGQSNTIYLNDDGTFPADPSWSSGQANLTNSIALGDVDGDGDLDLACGNYGQSNTIYLNDDGAFPANPSWSSGPAKLTQCIALADVDGDGDLDLIGGNNTSNTLYRAVRNPAFRGSLTMPIHFLPNNSEFVRSVNVAWKSTNIYEISFKAFDVESDPVWIRTEYQFEGNPFWRLAEITGYPGNVGPLVTSPTGEDHSFDWDVSRMPLDSRKVIIRLRTISAPMSVSSIDRVSSYNKEIDPIVPLRPQIIPSDSLLSFSTITVGDTTSLHVHLSNAGNVPLTITEVCLPSEEMRCDLAVPHSVDPDSGVEVEVFLEPEVETAISGSLSITANDPITPVSLIRIQTDIRALEIESRLLTSAPELPLGEAITVIITPAPDVRVESGFLCYRPCGIGAFLDTIPLTRSANDLIAVVPGDGVTEAGLEYYIRVKNSGVLATDPPGAPHDSTFCQAVASPKAISATPHPSSGPDFLEGRDITVLVSLPNGTEFIEGTLHLRMGGEYAYQDLSLQKAEPLPRVVIPDSLVGPRGVEYWVDVRTLTTSLTYPAGNPEGSPAVIRVTVADLEEEQTSPANQYRMVTVPLDFGIDFTGTMEALLSDQGSFGPYDPFRWRCFRYLASLDDYAELSEEYGEEFVPLAGRAFWLICSGTGSISSAPVKGLSTPTDSVYQIALEPGWNQIGNPFVFPVAWDSILVDTLTMAEAEAVVEPAVGWETGEGYTYGIETLEPFEGYWVKNLTDDPVLLRIPPRESPTEMIRLSSEVRKGEVRKHELPGSMDYEGWQLGIRVLCEGAADPGNYLGVRHDASDGWDRHDRSEPPMNPGNAVSLYFPHRAWDQHPGDYTRDMRRGRGNSGSTGQVWRFDVAKSFTRIGVGDETRLEFTGLDLLPVGTSARLVDRHLGMSKNLQDNPVYVFHSAVRKAVSEDQARFALLVGTEDFITEHRGGFPELPVRTALHHNYPNPFSTSTVIRYDLARAADLSLRIYDAGGALVKVLEEGHRAPDRYEAVWCGENEAGYRAAPGIYFCRLATGSGYRAVRKIMLIR
jgi:hypothetical protein